MTRTAIIGRLLSVLMVVAMASATSEHGSSPTAAARGGPHSPADGIAFVLIAGLFITVGAAAIVYRRDQRARSGAGAGLASPSCTASKGSGHQIPAGRTRTISARIEDRMESALTRTPPVSPSVDGFVIPEHETASTADGHNGGGAADDDDDGFGLGFSCTFMDGADLLLGMEDEVELSPIPRGAGALDKQAHKTLKQWKPPRIKARLSDESRRRIAAMSLGSLTKNHRARNSTDGFNAV